MTFMSILRMVTFILVLIGALNWGLVGFFNYDLVGSIFGDMSLISRIIYALVGLSAIFMMFASGNIFSKCECLSYD